MSYGVTKKMFLTIYLKKKTVEYCNRGDINIFNRKMVYLSAFLNR